MIKSFLQSTPGKGTVAVFVAGCLTGWPAMLSYIVAALLSVFAGLQFRETFLGNRETARQVSRNPLVGTVAGDCDVAAILNAALAAKPGPKKQP